jgi:ABC-type transporter Mla subunit MlaD
MNHAKPAESSAASPRRGFSGKLALGIIGLIALIIFSFENSWLPHNRKVTFEACFKDPRQLRQGASVIMQNAKVGSVDRVTVPGAIGCPAEVTMTLTTGAANVPQDSTVSLENDDFLGGSQVVIHPGAPSAQRLGNGDWLQPKP